MSPVSKDSFTCPFLMCIPVISSSYLTELARALSRVVKEIIFVLLLILGESMLSLTVRCVCWKFLMHATPRLLFF